jgi:hypothetical protein
MVLVSKERFSRCYFYLSFANMEGEPLVSILDIERFSMG